MIYMSPIKNFDKSEYDFIRCPITKNKLGWKRKDTKVRVIPMQKGSENNMEGIIIPCKKCRVDYLITIEK